MRIYLRKRVSEELSPLFEMYIRPFEDQIGILWFYDLDVFLKALGAPLFDAKLREMGPTSISVGGWEPGLSGQLALISKTTSCPKDVRLFFSSG